MASSGIWVRVVIEGNTELTGFVAGADTPNDFWTTFKTQMVRVEKAVEQLPNGKKVGHDSVYVNRDRIVLAAVLKQPPA